MKHATNSSVPGRPAGHGRVVIAVSAPFSPEIVQSAADVAERLQTSCAIALAEIDPLVVQCLLYQRRARIKTPTDDNGDKQPPVLVQPTIVAMRGDQDDVST